MTLRFPTLRIIANPAAGGDEPVLNILNDLLTESGIDWQVLVTHQFGDAQRLAREAAAEGVSLVGVYGGDGTVMEVAGGLAGTDVPLAILPGGTGNATATDLAIPHDLRQAVALITAEDSILRRVDVGRIDDHYFLLRASAGIETDTIQLADRDLKNRFGLLAYAIGAVQAMQAPKLAAYRLTLDGEVVETQGWNCMVCNTSAVGRLGLNLGEPVHANDGLLDVFVLDEGLDSILTLAGSLVTGQALAEVFDHWQVREVTVEADPVQHTHMDGENFGQTPFTARVVPDALSILAPPPAEASA